MVRTPLPGVCARGHFEFETEEAMRRTALQQSDGNKKPVQMFHHWSSRLERVARQPRVKGSSNANGDPPRRVFCGR